MDSRKLLGFITFCFLVTALVGCADGVRKFRTQAPILVDDDQQPFTPKPDEYFSPFGWDAADNTFFRPLAMFFKVDPGGEANNVNALDEVPDSSWFTNRIDATADDPEALAAGPCQEPLLDPTTEWTIIGAKPNGANPGFVMKAADGRRYVVKFDGTQQLERATAADVIGSKVYWAAGYYTPCNQVVFFDPSILSIDPEATAEDGTGEEEPLTMEHIDKILTKTIPLEDGRMRASASLFLEGIPIGPWKYEGTRDDDPNDVFDHEDRRELRGMYIFAAWLNHFDSREQNTLAMYVETEAGGGYVRHNMIDFGDCFGSLWSWDGISRRLGHAYYFDFTYLLFDFLTLGFVKQPWDDAGWGTTGSQFAYYDIESFRPDKWKAGYPNPAFNRVTEADAAWAARILAKFDDPAIKALVTAGHLRDATSVAELEHLLIGRRDKLLRRYLTVLSPLATPTIETADSPALCLEDRALDTTLWSPETRRYGVQAWDDTKSPLEPLRWSKGEGRVCVTLPTMASTDDAYIVVDVVAETPDDHTAGPARVHLVHQADTGWMVVGLERPESPGW